jgi:hypothetical protein
MNSPSTVSPIYTPIRSERIAKIRASAETIGAHIHILPRIKVMQGLSWKESLEMQGFRTPIHQSIRNSMVADLYPPVLDLVEERDIILLGPNKPLSWEEAIAWGDSINLEGTKPREVFASVEQNPNLNVGLFNRKQVYVVATTSTDTQQVCCVWIGNKYNMPCLFETMFFGRHLSRYTFREPAPEPVQ